MANYDLYFPLEVTLEGDKYEQVPGDSGGCTKFGLTLDDLKEANFDSNHDGTFSCADVLALDRAGASKILKQLYWDYFRADEIPDQDLAEFIVDGGLNQGRPLMVKFVQSVVGADVDGHFGPDTFAKLIADIKLDGGKDEFEELYKARQDRYNAIVAKNPTQKKFINGWMNRLNAIKYEA